MASSISSVEHAVDPSFVLFYFPCDRRLGIGEPKVEDEMIKEINIMYSSTFRLQNIITPGISFHP